jgi:hypothetical protein
VARSSYVHPRINDAYLDGTLAKAWEGSKAIPHLNQCEVAVLDVLRSHAA